MCADVLANVLGILGFLGFCFWVLDEFLVVGRCCKYFWVYSDLTAEILTKYFEKIPCLIIFNFEKNLAPLSVGERNC